MSNVAKQHKYLITARSKGYDEVTVTLDWVSAAA